MAKRLVAVCLWFYIMLVAWNVVAFLTGASSLLGPVVAAAVTAFVAGDPMHKIWSRQAN